MTTYSYAIIGGTLIGLSAVLLMFWLGRIAGISGIVSSLLKREPDSAWRWLFIIGILLGAILFQLTDIAQTPVRTALPTWLVIVAGLLVGFGSTLGSGCTSGHGVCGLARFSVRSIAATCTFLVTAIITTCVMRHGLGVL